MKTLAFVFVLTVTALSGVAQEKYMFVFLNRTGDMNSLSAEVLDSLEKAHLENISRLSEERKLLAAGPFEGGGGIFILNTDSLRQARNWLQDDPAIHAGIYYIEILPWSPRKGSVCFAGSNAERVPYTFVRYHSFITKYNVREAPQWFRAHDVYVKNVIKTGNVISEGVFDNSDGSTMIMKGRVEEAVILADPAVGNGILQPDVKTLWIEKGSFCEK